VGSCDFGPKWARVCDECTSKMTCYSTSDKLRGVSIFYRDTRSDDLEMRGEDFGSEKLRLRDKVELKAQLLLLGVYIYSPRTILLIVHGAAE
jgi:hypothetical protein